MTEHIPDIQEAHPEPALPLLVSKARACELLGISLRTLNVLIADGNLPARRIRRRVLIEYRQLAAFAQGRRVY